MKTKQLLILLLMAFAGWFSPANATDVTVYAKCSTTPYIHVWDTGSGGTATTTPVAMTSWTDSNGVDWYKKTLTIASSSTKYSLLFVRDGGWDNKIGDDLKNNTGDVAFDLTSETPVRVPVPDADLYLIGDTFGWDSFTGAMTRNGSIYTWTGSISGGFALVDTGTFVDWDSFNNHRWANNNTTVSKGNTYNFTDNGDIKSNISSGTYSFIYNAETRQLSVKSVLYLVGSIKGEDKWSSTDFVFTDNEDDTYTITQELNENDQIKFFDGSWYGYKNQQFYNLTSNVTAIGLTEGGTNNNFIIKKAELILTII